MADSLVLKGVKDVRNQTGTELKRVNPKRGGDIHQIKRWWTPGTVSTVYAACTLFKVTQGAKTCYLAVDSQETSTIRIILDADFSFSFKQINGIKRAALYNENMSLIEHYAFPSISGGRIMTITPPGAAVRPTVVAVAQPAAPEAPAAPAAPEAPAAPVETIQDRAAAADHTAVVTVSTYYNNNKYYINGTRQDTISAAAGETIYFDLSDPSVSGHPLAIYTDSSKTTTVTVGVETSDDGEILLFTPPISGVFSYQCTQHGAMGGEINVV